MWNSLLWVPGQKHDKSRGGSVFHFPEFIIIFVSHKMRVKPKEVKDYDNKLKIIGTKFAWIFKISSGYPHSSHDKFMRKGPVTLKIGNVHSGSCL